MGNRYVAGGERTAGTSFSEEGYQKFKDNDLYKPWTGPIAPLTAADAAERLALAKEALRGGLLAPHTVEWFNEDANYSEAAAMPLMVKGMLVQRGAPADLPPMMRLLGCESLAARPADVPLLELLQAVEPGIKKDERGRDVTDNDEFGNPRSSNATRLVVTDKDLELLQGYTDPKVVMLGVKGLRTTLPSL